jgi:thioredoxin-like negative regulator of GroEL
MAFASCIALAMVLASWSFSGQSVAQPRQAEIDAANRLFQTGKFTEAGELYARMAAQDPEDFAVICQLGRIALLSNRLEDAQKWLVLLSVRRETGKE